MGNAFAVEKPTKLQKECAKEFEKKDTQKYSKECELLSLINQNKPNPQADSFFDVFFDIFTIDSFFDIFTELKATDSSLQTQIDSFENQDCPVGYYVSGIDKNGKIKCNPLPSNDLACGDGIVTAPEQCDDGNTIGGDGCSAICIIDSLGTDISITITTPVEQINYGVPFEYVIDVNVIGDPASNVHVIDTMHSDFTLLSLLSSGGSCTLSNDFAGSVIDCQWSSVEENSPTQLRISAMLDPTTSGSYTNTARVQSDTAETNLANNQAGTNNLVSGFTGAPDLAITKTGPTTASVGDFVSYEIIVRNIALFPAFNVLITDTAPTGVSISGVDAYYTGSDGIEVPVFCPLPGLSNSKSCEIHTLLPNDSIRAVFYTEIREASGSITNTATVSTTTREVNLGNNSVQFITIIQ
jgi:uncharacterized repeat protein (TIGR01451 family)